MHFSSMCHLCLRDGESTEHVFFRCSFADWIWAQWDVFSRGKIRKAASMGLMFADHAHEDVASRVKWCGAHCQDGYSMVNIVGKG